MVKLGFGAPMDLSWNSDYDKEVGQVNLLFELEFLTCKGGMVIRFNE